MSACESFAPGGAMPLKTACDALERGVCLDLRYRGEFMRFEVHAAGYDQNSVPLLYGWQRVGMSGGGWRQIRVPEVEAIEDSGYFSEAPRPGYRPTKAFSKILCEV